MLPHANSVCHRQAVSSGAPTRQTLRLRDEAQRRAGRSRRDGRAGVATSAEAGQVLHALLAAADLALAFAAAEGGNRVARLDIADLGGVDSWSTRELVAA